jgi:hypothetical protein
MKNATVSINVTNATESVNITNATVSINITNETYYFLSFSVDLHSSATFSVLLSL